MLKDIQRQIRQRTRNRVRPAPYSEDKVEQQDQVTTHSSEEIKSISSFLSSETDENQSDIENKQFRNAYISYAVLNQTPIRDSLLWWLGETAGAVVMDEFKGERHFYYPKDVYSQFNSMYEDLLKCRDIIKQLVVQIGVPEEVFLTAIYNDPHIQRQDIYKDGFFSYASLDILEYMVSNCYNSIKGTTIEIKKMMKLDDIDTMQLSDQERAIRIIERLYKMVEITRLLLGCLMSATMKFTDDPSNEILLQGMLKENLNKINRICIAIETHCNQANIHLRPLCKRIRQTKEEKDNDIQSSQIAEGEKIKFTRKRVTSGDITYGLSSRGVETLQKRTHKFKQRIIKYDNGGYVEEFDLRDPTSQIAIQPPVVRDISCWGRKVTSARHRLDSAREALRQVSQRVRQRFTGYGRGV